MSTGQSTQQAFHSQAGSVPSVIRILDAMSQAGAPAGSQAGSQAGSSSSSSSSAPQPPMASRPTFITTDDARPTVAELAAYQVTVEQAVGQITFLLDYLGDDRNQQPPRPSTTAADGRPGTIWKAAHDIGVEFGRWEHHLARIKLEKAQNEAMVTRQMSMSVQPQGAGGSFKTPLPNTYDGKTGDPAFTFIAACNNYRIMKPNAFPNDMVFIRWALQQMEGKAGQWKVRQMMRMDEQTDDQGNPPRELADWKEFAQYFLTQYGDLGLIEQAKVKWKGGINQRVKAVDYFEEIETVLLRLNYQRDSQQTLDQILAGLKQHIRTHFIGKEWKSLNDMKKEVVPYDAAFWEINTRATGEKTRTYASSSKATSSTTHERGKSQTPQIKAEVSKTGGTQRRFLPEDKFEYCKKNRLCFMCKADGLEIVGSAKFHPNHLPQNTTKNKDKEIKRTKIAATQGQERKDTGHESGSDTDCEQSKN